MRSNRCKPAMYNEDSRSPLKFLTNPSPLSKTLKSFKWSYFYVFC